MKYCIFYNPLSRGNTHGEVMTKLSELYGDAAEFHDVTKGNYESVIPTLDADDVVVVCGGDGTLNRFVNAISGIDFENEILYYPTGSGNDFLRDVDEAADKPFPVKKYIQNLPTAEIDGKEYRFLNGVGYGIDGYCCEVGDEMRRRSDKPVNYTAIAIKGLLLHYKPTDATVTVDGVRHKFKKVWLAPTMNGKYYGGGMMPTPDQDRNNNDELSVLVFHGTGKLKTLMIFPSIFTGDHVKNTKSCTVLRGKEISVEFSKPTPLQLDGETMLGIKSYTAKSPVKAKKEETV